MNSKRCRFRVLALLAIVATILAFMEWKRNVTAWSTHNDTPSLGALQLDIWDGANANVPTTTTRLRTHAWLTDRSIQLYEQTQGIALSNSVKQAIILGSVAEDWDASGSADWPASSGLPVYANLLFSDPTDPVHLVFNWPAYIAQVNRTENHYYAGRPTGTPDDPDVNREDRELTYSATPLGEVNTALNTSAPRWAGANAVALNNYFNWTDAIDGTGQLSTPLHRFRALGHVLHLLQDMASPGHVRNDNHLWGDPYETVLGILTWADHATFGGPTWPAALLPLGDATADDITPLFYELAEYVQQNFWSSQTIGKRPADAQAHHGIRLREVAYQDSWDPDGLHVYVRNAANRRIAKLSYTGAGYLVKTGLTVLLTSPSTFVDNPVLRKYLSLWNRHLVLANTAIARDCWADVAPRAVERGASLIKLFIDTTGLIPPGAFSLSTPANGAAGVSLTPTLTWTDATWEASYTLQIDSENTFSAPLVYQNTAIAANATSFAVPGGILSVNTQYFWRVAAVNGLGSTTAANAPFSITTTTGPGTWSSTGLMGTARSSHTATLLDSGKVLVAGGFDVAGVKLSSCELYDPSTGTWANTGSMGTARVGHTATLLDSGKVLVAGSGNEDSSGSVSCELYDPSTGTWSNTGSMEAARFDHRAVLLDSGKVLVAGGADGIARPLVCELYDPSTGTWADTGSIGTGRVYHTATLLDSGKVLVAGGEDGLSSCELYDHSTGTWSSTGSMEVARCSHEATVLTSGKVLVSGACLGGFYVGSVSCELYDPPTGTWSSTGSMGTARYRHTLSPLDSGRALVAGGINGVGTSSCELYDSSGGTWSSTGSMGTTRYDHTATLLTSGKVLVAGGNTNAGRTSSCELYEP